MPVSPTYPGVYIEEIPSGVRTITGVGTSIAAFVGYTQRGPTDLGIQLFNVGDFERQFGGLDHDSAVSYAVQQFFLNGGSEAWVIRVAAGAAAAAIGLKRGIGGADIVVLTATARSQGRWGNNLRLDVDYATANPASLFNLTVTELVDQGGTLVPGRVEVHRNLGMNSFSASYAPSVVNAASELIRLERPGNATTPIQNTAATSTSGTLEIADLDRLDDDHRRVAVTINGDGPHEVDLFDAGGAPTGTLNVRLNALASLMQTRIRALRRPSRRSARRGQGAPSRRPPRPRTARASAPPSASASRHPQRRQHPATRDRQRGREADGAAGIRPAQSGTVGGSLVALTDLTTLPEPASINVTVQSPGLADVGPDEIPLWTTRPTSLEGVRTAIQAALAASPRAALNRGAVSLVDNALRIVAGGTDPNARLDITEVGAGTIGGLLRLTADGVDNVSRYALGVGAASQGQAAPVPGDDGAPPTANRIRGSRAAKSGLFALEDVDLFNILCLPNVTDVAVLSDAIAYADERRAFVLLDFPAAVDSRPRGDRLAERERHAPRQERRDLLPARPACRPAGGEPPALVPDLRRRRRRLRPHRRDARRLEGAGRHRGPATRRPAPRLHR